MNGEAREKGPNFFERILGRIKASRSIQAGIYRTEGDTQREATEKVLKSEAIMDKGWKKTSQEPGFNDLSPQEQLTRTIRASVANKEEGSA